MIAASPPLDLPLDLGFEPILLGDLDAVIGLARDHTDPRVASYAVDPPGAARRARLLARLARLPLLGARVARPEGAFWITRAGRREGFVRLERSEARLHLQLVVLTRALRGTGAADRVMAFVEAQARAAGCAAVDLYVDRRNYRAAHLYRRCGFATAPERRFIFEVPRRGLPRPRALASLPWHALAEILGAVGARGLPGPKPLALHEGRLAALSFASPTAESVIDAAVRAVFQGTLARSARVSLPFAANVAGGRLVAVLHRMEKVLS